MEQLPLRASEVIATPSGTPRTVAEARSTLSEFLHSNGSDRGLRLRAAVARRILNEENRIEVERLYAILYSIKSLRRARGE